MDEYIFLTGIALFTMLLTLVIQILTLNLTRKNVFLGVRIPEENSEDPELKELGKKFVKSNILIGVPAAAALSMFVYLCKSLVLFMCVVFGYIFILFLIYYSFNKKVKAIKTKNFWLNTKKQEVIIDTSFSREKRKYSMPSSWWFLLPLIIIAINLIINFNYYPSLPDRVATHWDINGHVNGWQNKSALIIYEMPLFQLFMTTVLFFSYKGIGWAKQEISSINPEESKERNRIFRRAWSIYFILSTIGINLIFTLGDLEIMQVTHMDSKLSMALILAFAGAMIISSLVLSIKVGQGGSRLKLNKGESQKAIFHRDDDKYWLLANSIYYNPEDPSLFVEKRFGIGWTINAGTAAGKAIYVFTVLLVIFTFVIVIFSKS